MLGTTMVKSSQPHALSSAHRSSRRKLTTSSTVFGLPSHCLHSPAQPPWCCCGVGKEIGACVCVHLWSHWVGENEEGATLSCVREGSPGQPLLDKTVGLRGKQICLHLCFCVIDTHLGQIPCWQLHRRLQDAAPALLVLGISE